MRVLLLAVLLSVLAAPSPAAAAGFQDLGPFPGSAETDGGRHLVGRLDDGSALVRDMTTGVQRTLLPPSRACRYGGAGGGSIVWSCSGTEQFATYGRTVDLTTGAEAELRTVHRDELTAYDGGVPYYRDVGRRWAGLVVSDYRRARFAYVNRATGELRGEVSRRTEVADLDAPRLVRPLCAPMRRSFIAGGHRTGELAPLAIAGRAAATVVYARTSPFPPGRLVLQRCGKRTKTIRDCSGRTCGSVVIDDRTLAWLEVGPPPVPAPVTQFRIRTLRTGRTRTFVRDGYWSIFLHDRRLYGLSGGRLYRITS